MCGIMGYVGNSMSNYRTHELSTSLLRETQSRGKDATGFASLSGNRVDFFKRNIAAQDFVKIGPWKNRCVANPNVLIGHTRFATHGPHIHNINNHPHISDDQKVSVVHNGVIVNYNSMAKKLGLNLRGECDSEVILRAIENSSSPVDGIKTVFEEAIGQHACLSIAFSEEHNKHMFYAWRSGNPMVMIDLRQELGQYFFSSTDHIWKSAVTTCGMQKLLSKKIEVVNENEIIEIDPDTLTIIKHEVPTKIYSLGHRFPGVWDDEISISPDIAHRRSAWQVPSFNEKKSQAQIAISQIDSIISSLEETKETIGFMEGIFGSELDLREVVVDLSLLSKEVKDINRSISESYNSDDVKSDSDLVDYSFIR